ncbi:Conserved_hypothetical protein [Hexamita inflata]|uniref:N-acetyltransferase domain-containing protein n=1 Tax=Hexamita inflata TaxID=28002 RepID=A0AA86TVI5_9EUKA|nr:Conserved hypothetical protein [Hexamita inflata]
MLHITPQFRFKEIFDYLQQNKNIVQYEKEYDQIDGLSSFHRATHIEENGEICAFSCYLPSYLISAVKNKQTQRYLRSIADEVDFPIIQNDTHEYSDCIYVPFIASNEQNLPLIMYFAAVQSVFKQLPIIIPKRATPHKLDSIFKKTSQRTSYCIIFPVQAEQFITNKPTLAGPLVSKFALLHPVQIDNEEEILAACLVLQSSFQNDPLFSVYEQNTIKRAAMIGNIVAHAVRTTTERGTNFLFCPFYIQPKISKAVACIVSTPPGGKNPWGTEPGSMMLMGKQFGTSTLRVCKNFDTLHEKCCGQVENHYYVALIGCTKPGHGIGKAIMSIPMDIAAQVGADFYLENSTQDNTKFYEGLGLKQCGELVLSNNGISATCWALRKDPHNNDAITEMVKIQ